MRVEHDEVIPGHERRKVREVVHRVETLYTKHAVSHIAHVENENKLTKPNLPAAAGASILLSCPILAML